MHYPNILFALCLGCAPFARGQDTSLLDTAGKFRSKITFSDSCTDKLRTLPAVAPDPATHELDPSEKISATITGNLANFDFTEIADGMPVEVNIGGFDFLGTLGDTIPLDADGNPRYSFDNSKLSSATFYLTTDLLDAGGNQILDAAGNPKQRSTGTIRFSWSLTTKLVSITVTLTDAVAASLGDTDVADHLGENDLTPTGGAGKIVPETVTIYIGFGTATGSHDAIAKGISMSKHARFGPDGQGGFNEDLVLNTVILTGTAAP